MKNDIPFSTTLFDLLTFNLLKDKVDHIDDDEIEKIFNIQNTSENAIKGENNIHYNDDLITLLEKQHKVLFKLYGSISKNIDDG